MTAQRADQLVLAVLVVHGSQVGVLYSAEALSLVPGQGGVDEVVLLRCFGQKFRHLENAYKLHQQEEKAWKLLRFEL